MAADAIILRDAAILVSLLRFEGRMIASAARAAGPKRRGRRQRGQGVHWLTRLAAGWGPGQRQCGGRSCSRALGHAAINLAMLHGRRLRLAEGRESLMFGFPLRDFPVGALGTIANDTRAT